MVEEVVRCVGTGGEPGRAALRREQGGKEPRVPVRPDVQCPVASRHLVIPSCCTVVLQRFVTSRYHVALL